ncbi:MAG: hypothetical protein RL560_921 [Actinomycetota bacterium]
MLGSMKMNLKKRIEKQDDSNSDAWIDEDEFEEA